MKLFFTVVIYFCCCNYLRPQSATTFIKNSKEIGSKLYLKTKFLNDTIVFFQLNAELKCTNTSIFGIAIRKNKDIFISTNLYYGILESYTFIDSNLFNSPSNSKIFLNFNKKDTCNLSGVNTGLLFGHSTALGGNYFILKKKQKNIFNCNSEDAIGSYKYEKFDTLLIQTYSAPHPVFKAKNIVATHDVVFYYFPFYVNGYIPFFESHRGVFWVKDSDILKSCFVLKL